MDNDLSTGPYYAIAIAPGIHHTMGAWRSTPTEVIATDNEIIPGLFAAGEVTGGLHGENRIGGMPLPISSFDAKQEQKLPNLRKKIKTLQKKLTFLST